MMSLQASARTQPKRMAVALPRRRTAVRKSITPVCAVSEQMGAGFAKAANAAPDVATFAQSNPLLYQALMAVGVAVAIYVAAAILNTVRKGLYSAWVSAVESSGPGSLTGSFLSAILNIVGVDLSTSSASVTKGISKPSPGTSAAAPASGSSTATMDPSAMVKHLTDRTDKVQKLFPGSLAVDDFLSRVEVGLAAFGFRGDNSLALTNVCRDESTGILKNKIDEIYGQAFNINGLGGVLTCGVTGIGAGISHAPIDEAGRERYVFFAFPHVAVDERGEPAAIFRPGRGGQSAACGALLFATNAVKEGGIEAAADEAGTHDPKEPEGSILMQRIKEQMRMEKADPASTDVVEMTKIANRVITRDLEGLIAKAVDTGKADYAVITGVQVHSWPSPESGAPVIEYVMPAAAYTVINGTKSEVDLTALPPLTPRQVAILSAGGAGSAEPASYLKGSTAQGTPQPDPAMVKPSPLVVGARSKDGQGKHEVPEFASQFSKCC